MKPEKLVRQLAVNAGAVSGLRIASGGAAVHQALKHLDAHFHNVVSGFAVHSGDQPHAAGVVFIFKIVKSAIFRRARRPTTSGALPGPFLMLIKFLHKYRLSSF